jgi:hypothetical protein
MVVLRAPPEPISVSSVTPEAWTNGKASVHSIEQAVAVQRGVVSLPWKLIEAAITGAMNSGFIRFLPRGASWPCQPHSGCLKRKNKNNSEAEAQEPSEDQAPWPKPKTSFREAVLDSSHRVGGRHGGRPGRGGQTSRCGSGWL